MGKEEEEKRNNFSESCFFFLNQHTPLSIVFQVVEQLMNT